MAKHGPSRLQPCRSTTYAGGIFRRSEAQRSAVIKQGSAKSEISRYVGCESSGKVTLDMFSVSFTAKNYDFGDMMGSSKSTSQPAFIGAYLKLIIDELISNVSSPARNGAGLALLTFTYAAPLSMTSLPSGF